MLVRNMLPDPGFKQNALETRVFGDEQQVMGDYLPTGHALTYAERQFGRGERVDMGTLASALGVGRTTLYRWVGDREQLISEILARMSDRTFQRVTAEATGQGIDRALDIARRFMEVTAVFPPLREFAQREPGPALRVLMSEQGAVAAALRRGLSHAFEHATPAPDPEVIDIAVQLGTALQWVPIAIGEEPAIDRATRLMRTLLENSIS